MSHRLRREIEPGAGRTVLYLDDPEVRIEGDLPFEPLFRLTGIDAVATMRHHKNPLDAGPGFGGHGLRRRPVERRAAVQVIDFHENSAGLCGAAAAEDRACPFHSASTQIGGDPDVGTQAQPGSASPSARGHGQLLDQARGDVRRKRQAMGPFEIPQRLLGCETVIPVRLDRVAKLGQRGLGGQNEVRPIDPRLPAQEIRDRIGRS